MRRFIPAKITALSCEKVNALSIPASAAAPASLLSFYGRNRRPKNSPHFSDGGKNGIIFSPAIAFRRFTARAGPAPHQAALKLPPAGQYPLRAGFAAADSLSAPPKAAR